MYLHHLQFGLADMATGGGKEEFSLGEGSSSVTCKLLRCPWCMWSCGKRAVLHSYRQTNTQTDRKTFAYVLCYFRQEKQIDRWIYRQTDGQTQTDMGTWNAFQLREERGEGGRDGGMRGGTMAFSCCFHGNCRGEIQNQLVLFPWIRVD